MTEKLFTGTLNKNQNKKQKNKHLLSETAWPIKAKFHVEPPWEGGKKFYINGSGHMTKMIAMPIYGKNLKKSSPTDLIVLCS